MTDSVVLHNATGLFFRRWWRILRSQQTQFPKYDFPARFAMSPGVEIFCSFCMLRYTWACSRAWVSYSNSGAKIHERFSWRVVSAPLKSWNDHTSIYLNYPKSEVSGLRITLLGTQALPQKQPFLFEKFPQVKLLRVYKGHAGVPLISVGSHLFSHRLKQVSKVFFTCSKQIWPGNF